MGSTVSGALGSYGQDTLNHELCAESLFSNAEHDNGWTEWEANPKVKEATGFPLGLPEVRTDQEAGTDPSQIGLTYFSTKKRVHLMMSYHT